MSAIRNQSGIETPMEKRQLALESRVEALEKQLRLLMFEEVKTEGKLLEQYGEYVDKTVAAQILGVTRATVYAMLADGRIRGGCSGKRVSVRSIAAYMKEPYKMDKRKQGVADGSKTEG